MTEPRKKMRKVTLWAACSVGGRIKKEPEKQKSAPLHELEQHPADTDVPDIDDDVLNYGGV